MDIYSEYMKLSDEELNTKIQKLSKMYNFYHLTDNGNMENSIADILQICYNIQDERADMRYYESLNTKENGVVIDAQVIEEPDKPNEPDQPKRRRRSRSFI